MTGRAVRFLTGAVAAVLLAGAAAPAAAGDDASAARPPDRPTDQPGGSASASAPGDLLGATPIPAPDGARAWRVRYRSRSLAGDDVAVSGVVVAPDGPAPRRGRPVVAWAHGTTGVADVCAPSGWPDPFGAIPWVDELLDAGYVVAATAYEGLGSEGTHPYLVGESEGRAVLDSIRAARGLPVGAGRKAVVYGHSQGGHAALFAGELAKEYAPELSLRGVAAGAPAASPAALLDDTVGPDGTAGFLVMVAQGYRAVYPELAARPILSSASPARVEAATSGCAYEVLEAFRGADAEIVFGVDPAEIPEWQRRLDENSAGLRRSAAPVLYWQGADDDLTPVASADAYAARACARGTRLDYRVYPGADHSTVVAAARDDVLAFVEAVLSGKRPKGTCDDR